MKKAEIEKILKKNGFEVSHGSRHDIWKKDGFPPIPVPRHREIAKGTAKAILKTAKIK
jgi:predicted RNA binding protein YcfA (HicA-like mRNA interferase family)